VTVEDTGGATRATAIRNEGASSSRLTHVTAKASGGSTNVAVDTLNASPEMTDVTAAAAGGSGPNNYALYNNGSSPTLTNVTATASGGDFSIGALNNSSSPVIRDSTLEAGGGSLINRALTGDNGGTIRVDNSRLTATGGEPIVNTGSTSTMVGASRLEGESVCGTVPCAGVYDETYTFLASTCPGPRNARPPALPETNALATPQRNCLQSKSKKLTSEAKPKRADKRKPKA